MELSEYLGRIWHWMWLIVAITVIAVILDIVVLWLLPRQYQTTSMLEVGGIQNFLSTPGTARDTRLSLPSATQASTETYLSLLQSESVKQEALRRVQGQLTLSQNSSGQTVDVGNSSQAPSLPGSDIDFSYQSRAEPIRGGGTDIIYIDVNSNQPATAKAMADALAAVLIEQVNNLSGDTADEFVRSIQVNQIDPINKQMSDIRSEIENLKVATSPAVTERNVKISNLEDEATLLDDTRKQYTDTIGRIQLNEALDKNDLQIFSQAVVPTSKERPDFLRTGVVAGVAGIIIGLITALFLDRRKLSKSVTVF